MSEESFRRTFAKLIFEGRINSALRLLDKSVVKGGVQEMTKEVEATLRKLHPQPEPESDDVLCRGTPPTLVQQSLMN